MSKICGEILGTGPKLWANTTSCFDHVEYFYFGHELSVIGSMRMF